LAVAVSVSSAKNPLRKLVTPAVVDAVIIVATRIHGIRAVIQ
jgi:hypothetical protein